MTKAEGSELNARLGFRPRTAAVNLSNIFVTKLQTGSVKEACFVYFYLFFVNSCCTTQTSPPLSDLSYLGEVVFEERVSSVSVFQLGEVPIGDLRAHKQMTLTDNQKKL